MTTDEEGRLNTLKRQAFALYPGQVTVLCFRYTSTNPAVIKFKRWVFPCRYNYAMYQIKATDYEIIFALETYYSEN